MSAIEILVFLILLMSVPNQCPNLTIVALGASILLDSRRSATAAGWLLLTGLLLTVFAIVLLPVHGRTESGRSQDSLSDQAARPLPEPKAGATQADRAHAERLGA